MRNNRLHLIVFTTLALGLGSARAQDPAAADHSNHAAPAERAQPTTKPVEAPPRAAGEHDSMPGMDHSGGTNHDAMPGMEQGAMEPSAMPAPAQHVKPGAASGVEQAADTGGMNQGGGMDHGSTSMQGGSPPPDARDPHAYADGYDFGPLRVHLADEHSRGSLLVDNLETLRSPDNTSAEYDLQAWYGRTYDRAVLKAEGEVDDGRLAESRTELLWSHAVAAFWDAQLGARHDGGRGPDRSWLAFGVQGLAPYWFAIDAAAYVGENGRSALRLDAEYELLLTQKLILQPKVETNFYGKSDAARGLGSGLSDVSVALRLRYEIWREFAPYIGIERVVRLGGAADLARAAGADATETRIVAGVRFWF